MLNLFRRRRGSPDAADRRETSPEVELKSALVRSDSVQSVDSVARKRVTWAPEMERIQLLHHVDPTPDSSEVSSSDEEEANREGGDSGDESEHEEACAEATAEGGSSSSSNLLKTPRDEDNDEEEDDDDDDDDDEDEEDEEEEEDDDDDEEEENKPAGGGATAEDSGAHAQTLRTEMEVLSRDLTAKATLVDMLQAELRVAHQEAELSRFNMCSLQAELEQTKQSLEMSQANQSETESDDEAERAVREEKLKAAETRISGLEDQLRVVVREKEEVEVSLSRLTTDKDDQLAQLHKLYEEALREQDEMMCKFEEELEEVKTVNSRREQQLLDDLEWKLREVEKNCKARLERKERESERRAEELGARVSQLTADLQEAKTREEVSKLELDQTHSTNTELQRNLRWTNRKLEEVQVSEKVLQEEASRLRTQLDKDRGFVASLQVVHREELDERERKMNFRLDAQKNLLNSEWEDRMKQEMKQLKEEMERKTRAEVKLAEESMRAEADRTVASLKADHLAQTRLLESKMEGLSRRLLEEESRHRAALEDAQTTNDSQVLELRRKMDRLYMSYEERIEKLNDQHEQHISRIQEECDKKVQEMGACAPGWGGAERLGGADLRKLEAQHQQQLEEERNRMEKEKEEALKAQEERHKQLLERLNHKSQGDQADTDGDNKSPNNSRSHNSVLRGGDTAPVLSPAEAPLLGARHSGCVDTTLTAEMCRAIQHLTLQLEASKKEAESLRSRLGQGSQRSPAVSEAIHPLGAEPPEVPPRHRGRHHAVTDLPPSLPVPTAKVPPRVCHDDRDTASDLVACQPPQSKPVDPHHHLEETPAPPSLEPPLPRPQQSRRSRKHRSRRH